MTDGTKRADIKAGIKVSIVLKKDQRTGTLTKGIVKDILTTDVSYISYIAKVPPVGVGIRRINIDEAPSIFGVCPPSNDLRI